MNETKERKAGFHNLDFPIFTVAIATLKVENLTYTGIATSSKIKEKYFFKHL